jgi:hypothetical protein
MPAAPLTGELLRYIRLANPFEPGRPIVLPPGTSVSVEPKPSDEGAVAVHWGSHVVLLEPTAVAVWGEE